MEALYLETNNLLQQVHLSLGQMEAAKDEGAAQKIVQSIYSQMDRSKSEEIDWSRLTNDCNWSSAHQLAEFYEVDYTNNQDFCRYIYTMEIVSFTSLAEISIIDSHCSHMDSMVNKAPPQRRQTLRYKLDQLKYDCQALRSTVSSLHVRLTNKWRAIAQREELLTTRFRANDSTRLSIGDGELELNDRLLSSNKSVDDLINHGSAVLEQLRLQGLGLRGIKRRILDIGQQLGLSQTTLRVIERRVSEDWIIFMVGCVFVLLFMYAFYRYWKM